MDTSPDGSVDFGSTRNIILPLELYKQEPFPGEKCFDRLTTLLNGPLPITSTRVLLGICDALCDGGRVSRKNILPLVLRRISPWRLLPAEEKQLALEGLALNLSALANCLSPTKEKDKSRLLRIRWIGAPESQIPLLSGLLRNRTPSPSHACQDVRHHEYVQFRSGGCMCRNTRAAPVCYTPTPAPAVNRNRRTSTAKPAVLKKPSEETARVIARKAVASNPKEPLKRPAPKAIPGSTVTTTPGHSSASTSRVPPAPKIRAHPPVRPILKKSTETVKPAASKPLWSSSTHNSTLGARRMPAVATRPSLSSVSRDKSLVFPNSKPQALASSRASGPGMKGLSSTSAPKPALAASKPRNTTARALTSIHSMARQGSGKEDIAPRKFISQPVGKVFNRAATIAFS